MPDRARHARHQMDSRQPRRLRPRADAARPAGRGEAADRDRRAPPRRDPEGGSGAGAAQRGLARDRRGQEEQRGGARADADGRGRASSRTTSRSWRPRRRRPATSSTRRWPKFPTCRSTRCRTAPTRPAMSSIIISARSANYAFTPKQHFELGEALGQMDFETAAKLSGARFVVLKSGLARLERALGQFMLDVHTGEHGYTEVVAAAAGARRGDVRHGAVAEVRRRSVLATRTMTRAEMLLDALKSRASGQQEFATARSTRDAGRANARRAPTKEDYWLIPTAEVPLTNLVRESIVDEAELPMRLTACTPCFRAEAGAAGKDTRGMIRQHQFTKVELVSITTPEQIEGRARAHARLRRGGAAPARPALPRGDALHRRHGLRVAEDLRHRGLAARAEHVSRDLLLLGLRRLPGAAHERALPRRRAAARASCTRSTAPASRSAAR